MTIDPLEFPEWDKAAKTHDWRNHVGTYTKELWHTFSREQRYAIMCDADELADAEEWD